MQRYSIDLYVVVFDFLVDIFTNWSGGSSWDRFRHSFNRRYFEKLVESRKTKMEELSRKLSREAELANQRATFENQRKISELATYDETEAIISRVINGLEMRLGARIEKTLRESGRDHRIDMSRITLMSLTAATEPKQINNGPAAHIPSIDEAVPNIAEAATDNDDRQRLTTFIQSIQDFVQSNYVEDLLADAGDVTTDAEVYHTLHSWASSQKSLPLWIEGPFDVETPSQNTLTAASLVYTAQQSGASVISHFCGTGLIGSRDTYYSRQLTTLMYSIIAQIAGLRGPDKFSALKLSKEELSKLNRSPESLPEALALFRQLFERRPQTLFIVIDSLNSVEDLDDKKQSSSLREFLDIICAPRRDDDHRVTKICFTSDGHVSALGKFTARRQIQNVSYEASDLKHVNIQEGRINELAL